MRVYEYCPDSDRYASLTAVAPKTYGRLMELGSEPVTSWQPPNLRWIGGTKKGDFPNLATHFPIVSDRALKVLTPFLRADIDVLPVRVPGGNYSGLHVRDLPDCLDYEKSTIAWFEPGRARDIKAYAFRRDALEGHHLFRLKEYAYAFAYLSGELFDAIRAAGLEGLAVRLLWED